MEIHPRRNAATAAGFLKRFLAHFPAKVHTIPRLRGDRLSQITVPNSQTASPSIPAFARTGMPGKPQDKPSGNHPFDRACASAGIKHRLTKPFTPQTNGMVERFNRRINEAIGRETKRGTAKRLFANHADRDAFLKQFALDYNHTRLKCLGYLAPQQALANLTGLNTFAGTGFAGMTGVSVSRDHIDQWAPAQGGCDGCLRPEWS
ncbi:MAG: transposase family protein [Rhodomicrobium sp.]|nr:transposase family protein [Rhodomicrobium sp.]